jgi:16S rRNA (adenine1518-N6/adenine1519-N6)-dimethyltransferase
MQRLGQHFLKNKGVLQKIAAAAHLEAATTIVEVGPGHGELTNFLIEEVGGKTNIILIEKDPALFEELKERFENQSRIDVRNGDALKLLPSIVVLLPLGDYCVVGNIPYYITGKLLRTISELERKPKRSVLMVQEEVADRICAVPPSMNRLAASVQFWAETTIAMRVPKSDFLPPPKIDSAMIVMTVKKDAPLAESERYYRAVRAIFSQPRKTLLNNIAAFQLSQTSTTPEKQECIKALEGLSIDPKIRPQNLSVEDIVLIAKKLF